MANDNNSPYTTEEQRAVVMAAINSVDWSSFTSEEDMTRKITRRAITISKMLGERSIEMRTLNAVRIYAEITSCEFEESSQRYKINFKSTREGSEPEMIRSPRMDTYDGRIIKPLIDKLLARMADGGQVRGTIYKYNEPAPEGAKGPNVPSHGYRTCVWLDV